MQIKTAECLSATITALQLDTVVGRELDDNKKEINNLIRQTATKNIHTILSRFDVLVQQEGS